MPEESDNLILRYLRRVEEKMDRLVDDIHDIKVRLTAVGEGLVGIQRRIDRMENRLDRIERRLDLVEH